MSIVHLWGENIFNLLNHCHFIFLTLAVQSQNDPVPISNYCMYDVCLKKHNVGQLGFADHKLLC
uniref:Uncharacterized protein n=1 Tax=Anguilla anguilla TaxID=7936 RepID=A0A0E9X5K1_ANGAN